MSAGVSGSCFARALIAAQAANASKVSHKASRAEQEAAFKGLVADLRTACDSCHAVYLKSER